MNIKFVFSQASTKRGIVKAIVAIVLIFGFDVPDEIEANLLGGLFAIESMLGMFLSDKPLEKPDHV